MTMKTIWKYPLKGETCEIVMPKGSTVLSASAQFDLPMVWASVDPTMVDVKRRFICVPTGAYYDTEGSRFIGTIFMQGGSLVYHVFTNDVEYPVEG